jgi:DNA topoisomerase-1
MEYINLAAKLFYSQSRFYSEMQELIITEKPSAAKRIAESLADGKVEQKSYGQVKYYEIKRGQKTILIVPAVGHLYTVAEKKKSFKYPSFELVWKPVYEDNKNSLYIKKYIEAIQNAAKYSKSFVVACDYDIEGEVIGLNAIRFICSQEDAKRMKFSTLTKSDLIEAYESMSKTLDWGQARAGEARHFLDWMYGINLSRALTLAIRKNKAYRTMSSGRVQGPALKILTQREKEIQKFKPKKFWQIQLLGKTKNGEIEAWHKKDKFWDEKETDHVLAKVKDHDGLITDISTNQIKQSAPNPFDLTTLQTESYGVLGITPKRALDLAQDLYIHGYISYPRTSSQELPAKIGYKKIIENLMKQEAYKKLGHLLLAKKSLSPNNGKKTDPAHPAIYPTGINPKNLNPLQKKVYDLIVKRFFATFGDIAVRETMTVTIDVNSEIFIAKGTRTVEKGWHVLYEPYVKLKEEELPKIEVNEKVHVKKLTKLEKETQPPKRFTEASIIKELESKNLGTKATRAQIIENLYDREYVTGKSLEVTKLGMKTIETLDEYCPRIVDENLTRSFEEDMDRIRESKIKPDTVLHKAKKELIEILEDFKKNELHIGSKLAKAYLETEREKSYIGECPVCKKGQLHIIHSRKNHSRFIACNKYPDCTTTFSLPSTGEIKKTAKLCEHCNYPIIEIRKGRIPKQLCINIQCPTKKPGDKTARKEESEMQHNVVEEECPKCKEGVLIVRKSVYGHFLACNRFPKCRYTQNIKDGPLKEDFKK